MVCCISAPVCAAAQGNTRFQQHYVFANETTNDRCSSHRSFWSVGQFLRENRGYRCRCRGLLEARTTVFNIEVPSQVIWEIWDIPWVFHFTLTFFAKVLSICPLFFLKPKCFHAHDLLPMGECKTSLTLFTANTRTTCWLLLLHWSMRQHFVLHSSKSK